MQSSVSRLAPGKMSMLLADLVIAAYALLRSKNHLKVCFSHKINEPCTKRKERTLRSVSQDYLKPAGLFKSM